MLNGGLELNEINFLKSKIKKFSKEHIEFEGMLWFHIVFGIVSSIMAGKKYRNYILAKVDLSKYKFAKTYNKLFYYAYSLSEKSKILSNTIEITSTKIKNYIKEKTKEIKRLENELPKDKRLLKSEIKNIENQILPNLRLYKKTIEENFFEIKNMFGWYNKDIRIYVGNVLEKESYEFIVKIYTSDTFSIKIYPKILTIYPNLDFNIEELVSEPIYIISTFLYSQQAETKDKYILSFSRSFVQSNKIYSGGYLQGILGINDISPYEEALEIFWVTSTFEDRLLFIKNLFKLLGYNLKQKYKKVYLFKIKKVDFDIYKQTIVDRKELAETYFTLPEKIFLSITDAKRIVKDIKSIKNYKKDKCNVYTIAKGYSEIIHILEKNNIKIISLAYFAHILIHLDLFDFIREYIIKSIFNKESKDHKLIIKKQIKGKQLINEIVEFYDSEKTWKQFEKLLEKVFEYLFKDSFKYYYAKPQMIEYGGHRKPDLVISNANPIKDFWKIRKIENKAKRIIVDFKNYSDKITSTTISNVTKYLNDKKGNFAIVISKYGLDSSGIKEQEIRYFDHNQLIIVVDISDIIEMINYKINDKEPEEILERKIAKLL